MYDQKDIILGEDEEEFDVTIRPNRISRQRRFMAQWDANGKKINEVRKKLEDDEREWSKKVAEEKATALAEGKEWNDADHSFDDTKSEYDIDPYDGYISLCGIALEKAVAKYVTDDEGNPVKSLYNAKRQLTPEYRQFLEEVLDQETIFTIIEVCGGIKLNDENLVQMIAEAQAQEAENAG